jgi:SPP1 gp7 family putative phage head morphogenesis protein
MAGTLSDWQAVIKGDLKTIADVVATKEVKNLSAVTEKEIQKPAEKTVTALTNDPMSIKGVQGQGLIDPFLKDFSDTEINRVLTAIRQGSAQGKTNAQLIDEIRGTEAMGYRDGLLAITARNAEAVVNTLVQHIVSKAKESVYAANSNTISGVMMVAVLDSRTTAFCRSIDGQIYPINEGIRPPFHVKCRTTTMPILKGASTVNTRPTYYDWLSTQDAAFQDDVLGQARGKLFRDGGLTVEKFSALQIGKNFKPRTLKELAELEPQAFKRANI